jgi:flagellar hook-associated protein 1 FlgK
MPGTFAGIAIASSALNVDQTVLDVIGNNVANVNTPGYSRQTVDIGATTPITTTVNSPSPVQLGTGVQTLAINRATDSFLSNRILAANGANSQATQLQSTLDRVQSVYGEPSSSSLSSLMTAFYNSFQTLSGNAESTALRTTVVQSAAALTDQFKQVNSGLNAIKSDLQTGIQSNLDQVNKLAKQIASLNQQVMDGAANNEHPNGLQDQRDQLIQQLGQIVGVTTAQDIGPNGQPDGMLNVSVGGAILVQGVQSVAIPTQTTSINGEPYLTDGTNQIKLTGGSLAGMVQGIDKVTQYQTDLNQIASTLISQVNGVHEAGYGLDGQTGRAFFQGYDAASITVNPDIANNPSEIAAATPPAAGQSVAPANGDNALAIADLMNSQVFGNDTLLSHYNASIAKIGADDQSAKTAVTNQTQLLHQLQNMQSSVSGVSLDEEMTNLMQYQRSYQAAAKMLTTMDGLMDSLLNLLH